MTPTDSTLIHYDPEIMDTPKDESSVESGAEPVRGDGTDIKSTKIHFGLLKGKLEVPDDFDAPLPDDVQRSFEGR